MKYRIAYLTSKNPLDKRESSGVYYYQAKALKEYCGEIYYLGPVNNIFIKFFRKGINFLQRFMKKKYNHSHSIIVSKIYGIIFSKKLRGNKYDIVIADKSSCEIAYIKTNIPLVYSTDATFVLLNNYYQGYSNMFRFSEKESNIIEQKAINGSNLIICASEWAANSVIKDYNFPLERVHVLPRGANIDRVPDKEIISRKKKTDVCRLLFMGQDWYRKGYDVAYKAMDYIRSQGIPVKLMAVGCSPSSAFIDEDVEVLSFINKNTKEGMEQFDNIMFNSDFYLLPTRAECMGIAFCESSAYGLPVITRDTGGVTEVVKNGVNGYALNNSAGHKEYAERIISIFNSDKEYYRLIESSRSYYEQRLNWDIWGIEMKKILDSHLSAMQDQ